VWRGAGGASGHARGARSEIVVEPWGAVDAECVVGGGAAEAVGDGGAGEADPGGDEKSVGAIVAVGRGVAGPAERAGA
jgi:hypothetical protein